MTYDDEDDDDEDEEEELSDVGWGLLAGVGWAFLFRKRKKSATDED